MPSWPAPQVAQPEPQAVSAEVVIDFTTIVVYGMVKLMVNFVVH